MKMVKLYGNMAMCCVMCFTLLLACQSKKASFESVAVAEFEQVLQQPNVICLDVRTAKEYAEGHLPGAYNIDVLGDEFAVQANELLAKDKTIALYCRSGKRSKKAATILSDKGYKVIDLDEGFKGWVQAENPIEK